MYLASILFTDDEKLLVTLDENIPIIAVDDNHPSTFLQDFCWLMKVCLACTFTESSTQCTVLNQVYRSRRKCLSFISQSKNSAVTFLYYEAVSKLMFDLNKLNQHCETVN